LKEQAADVLMAYSHKVTQRTQLKQATVKSRAFIEGEEDDAFESIRKSNENAAEKAMADLYSNVLEAADIRARQEW